MEKRALLAIVLCFFVFLFQSKYLTPQKGAQKPAATQTEKSAEVVETVTESGADKTAISPAEVSEEISKKEPVKEAVVKEVAPEREIVVQNDIYQATFSNYGGLLKKVIFHHMKNDPKSRIVFNIDEHKYAPLAITRIGNYAGLEKAVYDFKRKENGIVFTYQLDSDVSVVKDITVNSDSYVIDINISFTNNSDKGIYFSEGYDINAGLLFPEAAAKKVNYLGVDGLTSTDDIHRQDLDEVEGRAFQSGVFKWVGVRNRTFASILIPGNFKTGGMLINSYKGEVKVAPKKYLCGGAIRTADVEIAPGETKQYGLKYYAGPKYMNVLEGLGVGAEEIMDLGRFLGGISAIMIKTLNLIYSYIPNYGVAIILLTILIKLILFPLTSKSFKSMNRMKALQPEINKLKEKYKDNPKKMQTETMGLYRKHKVNPLGGCLPILLQLPIFFALFAAIRDFVELQGATFLWAKDLSGPDTVMVIMGSIPINPLPLLMGASMFWQQKMTTVDPAQQKMMMFMPIIFTVMLYNFSSGLVIYWLVNNLLSIAQQASMQKQDALATT